MHQFLNIFKVFKFLCQMFFIPVQLVFDFDPASELPALGQMKHEFCPE